jgi:hypothetical protein
MQKSSEQVAKNIRCIFFHKKRIEGTSGSEMTHGMDKCQMICGMLYAQCWMLSQYGNADDIDVVEMLRDTVDHATG